MIIFYDQTDSTNRIAFDLMRQGYPDGTVVQAGQQSAGRGQHGRRFSSPPGGLYFSLLLRPKFDVARLPLVTLVTGLACCQVIAAHLSLHPRLKWPNDIYLQGRKLAGILCENSVGPPGDPLASGVIIGVGLNVNVRLEDFPEDLQPLVTSLFTHTGKEEDLASLLQTLLAAIKGAVVALGKEASSLLHQWQQYDYLLGKKIEYTAGSTSLFGIGSGIDHTGRYCLLDAQGVKHHIIGGQLRISS
ncbi:biotin--[acetyl-CoA-carboxylase] ligase [Desulfobulbus alkaliphilus]|uniref:biotin--[acetyl-CoA-carboxylase] ligase n=1 Tax=Desulfobulbus alkaliphilus TaxID=869814 RepID=UPI0019655FC8|nr:biotin--[acetyl-CoA-carboxylase] ligase [Desulfobulbus alkaliphilus]